MAYLKNEAPSFDGKEGQEEKLARLADFITRHEEELEYVLTHLSGENMNGAHFAVTVRDLNGNAVGTLGWTGAGVGCVYGESAALAGSGGAYLISGKNALRVTGEGAAVTEDGSAWEALQKALVFDSEPTEDSENPVTSGGVYEALQSAASFTVLWTNSSPSTDRNAFILSTTATEASGRRLSDKPENYDAIMIEFIGYSEDYPNTDRYSTVITYESGKLGTLSCVEIGSGSFLQGQQRRFTLLTNGFVFETGYSYSGSSGGSDVSVNIPTAVIGIKFRREA